MVTAQLVKELRERTGAGMMDCRKALEATAGDLDKAAEKLRMDGAAKADKKASRTAADGIVAIAENAGAVALVEVNSETDFVAKGADFQALANAAAKLALAAGPADVEALSQQKEGAQTLDEIRRALVAKIGENITIRRFQIVPKAAAATAIYVHPGAKIVSVVTLDQGDAELAKDLAMHVAASAPRFLSGNDVPKDVLDAERKIVEAQSAEQAAGKPAEIVAKMLDGKLRKFVAEITLLGQPFVKDPEQTVEKLLKAKGAQVARFVRFAVGEGIEKKATDFAAEVAAAAKG
ncbi:MAG: elongation factor Ts [Gammaproteobacteria bacterium]|nr:elongation factor Ts [Gammaproteobacteria bacterium]